MKAGDNSPKQITEEELMRLQSNTIAYPWAVVVHSHHTFPTNTTVVRAWRLYAVAFTTNPKLLKIPRFFVDIYCQHRLIQKPAIFFLFLIISSTNCLRFFIRIWIILPSLLFSIIPLSFLIPLSNGINIVFLIVGLIATTLCFYCPSSFNVGFILTNLNFIIRCKISRIV